MIAFLDTSAFAKRYVLEQGSEEVTNLCQRADSLIVSVICFPELVSTLSRLVREKRLAQAEYRRLKAAVLGDMKDMDICQITPAVLESVTSLLEVHPLRAMDGIHLACALVVAPDVFISANHRQIVAARKAGLQVVNVS